MAQDFDKGTRRVLDRLRQALRDVTPVEAPQASLRDDLASPAQEHIPPFLVALKALGPQGETEGRLFATRQELFGQLKAIIRRYSHEGWLLEGQIIPKGSLGDRPLGLSMASLLIASTATVVLSLPSPLWGIPSLLVEHHLVVAHQRQILPDMAAFVQRRESLARQGLLSGRQILVTGPSRTADVEKVLVIPAHGPKRLSVFICREPFDRYDLYRALGRFPVVAPDDLEDY